MYLVKNDKLYIQKGDKTMVGVEIYFDHIVYLDDTETELSYDSILSPFEVMCQYQINETNPYIFPIEHEVKKPKATSTGGAKSGTTRKAKTPTGSTGK